MDYLDPSILIHAALDDGERGAHARQLLRRGVRGEADLLTSTASIQEAAAAIGQHADLQTAARRTAPLLGIPNVPVVPVGREDMRRAFDLQTAHALKPHHALHAAIAMHHRCAVIRSTLPPAETHPPIRWEEPQ